ncbi:hypothetical protein NDU88_004648 [Pleurodeles waltl]|uniref:Uncharacterized protein n=1 Tax=Pleurodeles waltl TaxID=8319 RepID=A0AAV7SJE0_PLEWA|nr:hypothetical protein NDU88_004648 [Pleurodeles waltl]
MGTVSHIWCNQLEADHSLAVQDGPVIISTRALPTTLLTAVYQSVTSPGAHADEDPPRCPRNVRYRYYMQGPKAGHTGKSKDRLPYWSRPPRKASGHQFLKASRDASQKPPALRAKANK